MALAILELTGGIMSSATNWLVTLTPLTALAVSVAAAGALVTIFIQAIKP